MGIERSSLTALFLASRPQGQVYLPGAAAELAKRYSFAGVPTGLADIEGNKISFRQGVFNDVGIESLEIYGDGIILSSKCPSDVLDALLADLIQWMESAFNMHPVETHTINRNYESNILVRSDANILGALDILRPVQDLVAKSLKATNGTEAKFDTFGLGFAADHSLIPSLKPIAFRVERRVGVAFDMNYYVSAAPLRTADHLKVLERLEKVSS